MSQEFIDPSAFQSADSFLPLNTTREKPRRRFRWKRNVLLFVLTVFSVFLAGALYGNRLVTTGSITDFLSSLWLGWDYAVPLLTILLFHEFGHYFAARFHRVEASLPFFIPFPIVSPFGTMGAVIAMKGRIKSRNALLDIGASGPLAGLFIAIPVLLIGLSHSPVEPMSSPGIQEGQSLLYIALKRIILGPIPEGYDVVMSPTTFAGWTGLFVTALNLLPVGQLDGGHIAYALFGKVQNRIARVLHWSLLGMFLVNLLRFSIPVLKSNHLDDLGQAVANSTFWLIWFLLIFAMKRIGGKEHPPTEPGELSRGRKAIAVFSLILWILLFMPTPWVNY